MQREIFENFWTEFESHIERLSARLRALSTSITPSEKDKHFLDRNLSASKKRSEFEKLLEGLESKISSLEQKALVVRRKRARLDPIVEELLENVNDQRLRDYIVVKLFRNENVEHLLKLVQHWITLPKAQDGDEKAFGKKILGSPYSEELKNLEEELIN